MLGRIETVVDLLGVVPADGNTAEQTIEKTGAGVGDFVEREMCFCQLGKDGQQPGAGRRFQHEIGCRHCGCLGGGEAERDRRRKLLEVLGFLGAAGLRRQTAGKPRQHVQHRRG